MFKERMTDLRSRHSWSSSVLEPIRSSDTRFSRPIGGGALFSIPGRYANLLVDAVTLLGLERCSDRANDPRHAARRGDPW